MGGNGGAGGGGGSPSGNNGGPGNGMSSSDLSIGSGNGGGGGGSYDMSSFDMAAGDNSCPLPHLIITAADINPDHQTGGELLRLPLGGGKSSCTTLIGQGLLGARLNAATYLAPGLIATGDINNTIYVVNASSDLIAWKKHPTLAALGQLFEAFPMKDSSGKDAFAIAFIQDGPLFGELRSWYADGSEVAMSPWCLSSMIQCTGTDLMLSNSIRGVAANPLTPAHFLADDQANNVPGLDVNPLVRNTQTFIPGNGDPLGAMYAITVGGKLRVAWLNRARTGTPAPTVDYYNDTGGPGPPVVMGPLKCQSTCPTFQRVVPDPTSMTAFFLLCGDDTLSNQRVVMRLQNDGTCSNVFDASMLASNLALTHLAIAQ
jgi:hypothetical protein